MNRLKTIGMAAALMLSASSAFGGAFGDFNLIVTGDLTGTSEVEGRTLVFGNISGGAKNVAVASSALSSPSTVAGLNQNDALIVGGQVLSTVQVNHGRARIATAAAGGTINNAESVIYSDTGVGTVISAATSDIAQTDTWISGLTANSSVDLSDFNNAKFTAHATGGIAVFDISSSFFSRNGTFDLLGDTSADLFVIRVSGSGSLTSGSALNVFANEFGQDAFQSRIVWDFSDFDGNLHLTNGLGGSVFAPSADLSLGSPIEGSVVAHNVNLSSEVHLPTTGLVIPEPGTAALLLVSIGLIGRRLGERD